MKKVSFIGWFWGLFSTLLFLVPAFVASNFPQVLEFLHINDFVDTLHQCSLACDAGTDGCSALDILELLVGGLFGVVYLYLWFKSIMYAVNTIVGGGPSWIDGESYWEWVITPTSERFEKKQASELTAEGFARILLFITYFVWCIPVYIYYCVKYR